jgi:iron complex transport system substrate-binding protein
MQRFSLKNRSGVAAASGRDGGSRRLVATKSLATLALVLLLSASVLSARLVTDQTGRRVNLPDHPRRLVSIAPSITETLFALGLGNRLVGDTDYCDYPPQAKSLPHVGAMLNPSLEKIVALKPDLVLGTDEANRRETADQLERLGIPLYGVTAHTVEGTIQSLEDLGHVLDWETPTQKLVALLRARVAAVARQVQGQSRPKVLFVVWYRPLITAPDLYFRYHPPRGGRLHQRRPEG